MVQTHSSQNPCAQHRKPLIFPMSNSVGRRTSSEAKVSELQCLPTKNRPLKMRGWHPQTVRQLHSSEKGDLPRPYFSACNFLVPEGRHTSPHGLPYVPTWTPFVPIRAARGHHTEPTRALTGPLAGPCVPILCVPICAHGPDTAPMRPHVAPNGY